MPNIKSNEYGFGLVYIVVIAAVVIGIAVVGFKVFSSKHQIVNNSQQYRATRERKGDLSNTFTFHGGVYPSLPTENYQIINEWHAPASDSNPYSQPYELQNEDEVDFITSRTPEQVRSDLISTCDTHKFSFKSVGSSNTHLECFASYTWRFNIRPASDIIRQQWYKSDSISEAQLAKMTFVQITSEVTGYEAGPMGNATYK